MPWKDAIKTKSATDEDKKKHLKESIRECGNCSTEHDAQRGNYAQRISRLVGNVSHFAVKCRSKKKEGKGGNARKFVRAVDNPDSASEVFYADLISAVDLDNSQLVTVKLESGNYLRF